MIGYITLGTNDIEKAAAFYDELLKGMNASRVMDSERFVVWSNGAGKPMFSILKPYDGNPATVGNGTMIALAADSTQQVDALHAKALLLGAGDEGAPGMRQSGFYCAYVRDLDGNKLNFFYHE